MDFQKKPLGTETRQPVEQAAATEPVPAVPSQPPVVTGKPRKTGKVLVWGLVVLLVAGLGAFAYWQWAEAKNADEQLTRTQIELSTANTKLANLDKEMDDADAGAPATGSAKTDDTVVKQTVAAHIRAQGDNKNTDVKVTIKEISSEFAHATLFEGGEGGTLHYILKKVDGIWIAVYDGIVPPEQEVVTLYGIPASYTKFF